MHHLYIFIHIFIEKEFNEYCEPGVGPVGHTNQDSIYFYVRLHRENIKQYSLNIFPPKVSRYFFTLLTSNCKFEITTVPQIDL